MKSKTFLQVAITGAAALGADSARLDDQSEFVSNFVDSMTMGVSTMTDTDMEEASARLSALADPAGTRSSIADHRERSAGLAAAALPLTSPLSWGVQWRPGRLTSLRISENNTLG